MSSLVGLGGEESSVFKGLNTAKHSHASAFLPGLRTLSTVSHTAPRGGDSCPHCIGEDAAAQRGPATWPRTHSL